MANRLKTLRRAAGLTQEELAEMAGLGPKYLSRLESARALPSMVAVLNLAAALGVEPTEMIGKLPDSAETAMAGRIAAAVAGLPDSDRDFVEEQLLGWIAQIKRMRRGT